MQSGDLFLARTDTMLGRVIQFGERLRSPRKAAFWTHAGIITSSGGDTIEALARGVVRSNLDAHPIHVVIGSNLDPEDRRQVIEFAESVVSDEYGWLDIASIGLRLLTGWHLSFHGSRSLICSQLAARGWEHGGIILPMLDTSAVMPSDLAEWYVPERITMQARKYAAVQAYVDSPWSQYVAREE